MLFIIILCAFLFIAPGTSVAYTPPIIITGTVVDATTQEPLAGVSIRIDGTTIGIATNPDGEFALKLPENYTQKITLVASYIGYKTYRITPENLGTHLYIQLEEDFILGDELVVSGQGVNMEKRRLSTSITTINEEEIEASPFDRIDQLLQSKVPNAQFKLTNGQPGTSSIIRARGVVSAFNNSTPIIYVDGVRVDNLNTVAELGGGYPDGAASSSMSDIPMENIERIEFINGGAATTLYGSDAANGVIQIFTKKGGKGQRQISFSTQIGATVPTEDYLYYDRTADLLFQTGFYQKYNLQFNGGEERFGYSFAGSITDDEGFRIENKNESQKIDLSSGFTSQISKEFSYQSTLSYTNSNFERVRNGNAGGYTGLWYAEAGASLFTGPGFNPNLNELSDEDFSLMKQYVKNAERLQDNETAVNRFHTSQIFEYKPSDAFLVKATAGIDYRTQNEEVITTNEYLNHVDNISPENGRFDRGSIRKFDRNYFGLTAELTGQHKIEINDFSFISTVGGQFFRDEDHQILYIGTNVRDGATSISQAASKESDEFLSEVVNYGIYAQENMGYKNRYFLEFGLRADGNTAFGDDVGLQYYPKVGLSYLVSGEPFFLGMFDNSTFSYLKLKANYGVAGNFPKPFANEQTVSFTGFLDEQAATFGQPGNDDLKPEKTYSFETGADFGFVKDRIQFSITYYYTETRDALFYVPLAPSTGEGTQLQNVGTIENKGFEFALTAIPVLTRDWNIRINASLNTLDNEVTDAGGAGAFHINGFSSRTIQTIVEEGYPVGYIRANKGTFENGVMVSTEPMAFLGSTIPDKFGSVSLNMRYKKIDFFTNADFQMGAYAHSFDRQFRFNYGASNEGIPETEIEAHGRSNWLNFTDQFVEKTDFFKVRTIGANYTIDQKFIGNMAKRIVVGFTAVNPLNFTKSSFDPEATQSGSDQGQNGATTGGIAYSVESAPRQFLGTLKIDF